MATNKSQLIFVLDADNTNGDGGIDYANSGGTTATSFAPDAPFAANPGFNAPYQIAADTAAGIYYVIDPIFTGDGSSGGTIVMAKLTDTSQPVTTEYSVPDPNGPGSQFGEAWALAIDTTNHVLYLAEDTFNVGYSDFGDSSGIIKFTYDPATGALGAPTDVFVRPTGPNNEILSLSLDTAAQKLYFVDDSEGTFGSAPSTTNEVEVLNLNTNAVTTLVTLPSGSNYFSGTNDYTEGGIVAVAHDSADGLVFFSTGTGFNDPASEALNRIYVADDHTANQTPVQLIESPSFDNMDPKFMSYDAANHQLWVSYINPDQSGGTGDLGHLVRYDVTVPTAGSPVGVTLSNPVDYTLPLAEMPSSLAGPVSPLGSFLDNLPVITTTGTATHAVEQGANVTLLTAETVTDADGNHLASATIQITGGTFASNETSANDDHLTIDSAHRTGTNTSGTINGTSISYSYNSATEKLTLSGYDTLADYQTALSFVQYFTTGDNPTNYGQNTTRTVTWQVNDGAIGDPSGTNTTTTTLNIDGKNDAPVASAPASYVEQEGVAKNLHNAGLSVSDVDGGIAGQNETATLSVTEGTLHAVAGTGASLGVGISGDGTGTLTITGTIAQINGLLNGDNTSILTHTGHVDANDTPNSITLSLSINDNGFNGVPPPGAQTSNTAQSTITAPDDTTVTFTGLSSNTSGSPVEGQQITATVTDGGLAIGAATYTWKVNGTTVQTGSSNSFTPTESNEGGTLTLDVAFNDPVDASITESDTNISVGSPSTVQESPTENASIAISGLTAGNAVEGTPLTATVTEADAPASGITYTWKVNNVVVHTGVDGTGNSYTPTETNEGLPISVSVSFTDTHGFAETGSASAGTVQESPTENASIAISGLTAGNAVDGTPLTATVTEPDAPAAGITYTWKVNNVVVHTGVDAAGKSYTPTDADENSPISVSVSFTDTHGFSETGTASAGTVQENPAENASIAISGLTTGNAVEGTPLTATVTESDAPASGITYTWKVNNVVVHTGVDGAGKSYTPTENDEGSPISVSVSFTDTHGFAEAGSASAGTVQESPTENASIAISGEVSGHPQEGTTLTATVTEGDAPASGITYTWTSNNVPVHTGVDGAGKTYTPVHSDDGHTIAVSVSFTDTHGFSETGTASAGVVQNPLTGHMVLTSATEGAALANSTTVATFSDTDNADVASDFTATINWGDGVTTTGTVVGSSGTFSVQGGHTYADEGSDPASVTITHTADNVSATASGSVAVGEGDVLTPHATALHLQANHAFTGVVATFSDTYTGNVPGDFTATIDWGDGTTTTGNVSGGSGSLSVSGTHIYTHPGHENISVTLADDAPGTATATAHSTANVSNGPKNDFTGDNSSDLLFQQNVNSAHPNVLVELLSNSGTSIASSAIIPNTKGWPVVAQADFNNDNIGDVVLQNTDGTPEIWLMNGTSVTSKVDLAGAGSSWHIIAAADFNNDGHPDLLFQADNGQVGLWMMNGTSVVSMNGLANPGSGWHVIGAGDFNNDGNADILFQNSDGTPMIWEMNGTSVISQATLTNPGSQWREVGTGDFNGDGNADILFQANNGQAGVWLMNGTSVVSMTGLGIPGPNYNAIGTSDFNGDGNADILFQNSNGTPQYWLMNGNTVLSMTTLPNPGAQFTAQADGPFGTDAGGSSGTSHLSTPDLAGPTTQAADAGALVPGTQNLLQQQQTGAGLHLT